MNRMLLSLLSITFINACGMDGSQDLQQYQLLEKMASEHPPLVIDVRSGGEYKAGHIPGALHIPFTSAFTTSKLDDISTERPMVLYCEHGPRASLAKLGFRMAGFKNITYLDGHMSAWRKAGLAVEK